MTFDPDFDLIHVLGHPTWQQGKINSGILLISINLVARYSTNMPANPKITSKNTTLKCPDMHLMTFDADFDLHWGHQTWKQGKISSGMFADIEKPSCPLFRKSAHKS